MTTNCYQLANLNPRTPSYLSHPLLHLVEVVVGFVLEGFQLALKVQALVLDLEALYLQECKLAAQALMVQA